MMFRYQFIFYEIAPKTNSSFLLISKEKKNYIFVNLRFFFKTRCFLHKMVKIFFITKITENF